MKKWGKPEEVIAQRISRDQIPGLLHKEIFLENDEVALVIKNAAIAEELASGRHALKDFSEIILVDTGPKAIRKTVENLLTADDNSVSCDIELKFDVYLPEKLARALLKLNPILTLDDLYSEIYNELAAKVLLPSVKEMNISDLAGNRKLLDDIQISFETDLKKTLETWGIELTNLSIIWEFPEDYKQYVKSRGTSKLAAKVKDEEQGEKTRYAINERELSKIKGKGEPTREEVKSKLQKQSIEEEVKLNIRKKESVEDAEEVLDALKLKEIMDKEKIAKESKKKQLNIEDEELSE